MDYRIGKKTEINCPDIQIASGVIIGDRVQIDVSERLVIGKNSFIASDSVIRGRDIELGREFYTAGAVTIGGGSCFESRSKLKTGYWCFLGFRTFVNTAEAVTIGNEVGIGGDSKLYTHGGYLSVLDGFPTQWGPITIGDRVWIPHATIHPNVKIGDDVVIGSHSLVTKDVPSGCLAFGIPCRVMREEAYPYYASTAKTIKQILIYYDYDLSKFELYDNGFVYEDTLFNTTEKRIKGSATPATELLRDRLRRWGIRFKSEVVDGNYQGWDE